MLRIWIIGGTVVIVALVLWVRYLVYFRGFLRGYRGAIGIKNRSDVAIMTAPVLGFTRVVACQNVARGGHSFSFLARQPLPERVEIIWRTATDGVEQQADIALAAVPRDLKDGKLFLVLSPDRRWTLEWAETLRLGAL
jgi:hypothetical protein